MSTRGEDPTADPIGMLRGKADELQLLRFRLEGVEALRGALDYGASWCRALEFAAKWTPDAGLAHAFRQARDLVLEEHLDLESALARTGFFSEEWAENSPTHLLERLTADIQRTRNEISDLAVAALLLFDERLRRLEEPSEG